MPSGLLETINIFPNTQLWRFKKQTQTSHKVGGIATIILITILLIIAIVRLVQVFQKQTVVSSSTVRNMFLPPNTTLTTVQDSSITSPFMFSLTLAGGDLTMPDLNVTAWNITQSNGNNASTATSTLLTLQNCTTAHFSKFPELQNTVSNSMNSWLCLPDNQNIPLGGNQFSSEPYSYIDILVNCSSTSTICDGSTYYSAIIQTFILNTFVNPNSPTEPFNYYISKKKNLFQWQTTSKYIYSIDQNQMTTDNSVFPWESNSYWEGFQLTKPIEGISNRNLTGSSTTLRIQRSEQTSSYKRGFDKILDALAYVGGLMGILVGLFFFLKSYGEYAYEMEVGQSYFHCQQAKQNGFWPYLTTTVYSLLKSVGKQQEWAKQQKIQSLRTTVNNMLDVVYLQRRIQYLQNALLVLLEKHQLKGLHLIHNRTKEQADSHYKDHQIRNQLVCLIQNKDKEHNNQVNQVEAKKDHQIKQNIEDVPMAVLKHKYQAKTSSGKQMSDIRLVQFDSETDIHLIDPNHQHKDIDEWSADSLQQKQMYDKVALEQIKQNIKHLLEESLNPRSDIKNRKIANLINNQLKRKLLTLQFQDHPPLFEGHHHSNSRKQK